jgi:predicted transcriptional regulator
MSKISLKEWLKTHPLSFEVLKSLLEEKRTTSSKIANELGRSIPTIYMTLRELETMNVVNSEKVGRKREFYAVDEQYLTSILADKEMIDAFKTKTYRLRYPSIFLEKSLEDLLFEEFIEKGIEVIREVKVESFLGTFEADFSIRHKSGERILVNLEQISAAEREDTPASRYLTTSSALRYLGIILDLSKGPSKIDKLISVLLLGYKKTNQFNEWKYKELLESLSSEEKTFETIIIHVDDPTDPYFIKGLVNRIIERIS